MKKYALVALFAVMSLGMVFAVVAVPPTQGNISITGEVKEAFSLLVPPDYKGTIEMEMWPRHGKLEMLQLPATSTIGPSS